MFKCKDLGNPNLVITETPSLGWLQLLPPHLALSPVAKLGSDLGFSPTKQNLSGWESKICHPRVAAHPGWGVAALGGLFVWETGSEISHGGCGVATQGRASRRFSIPEMSLSHG